MKKEDFQPKQFKNKFLIMLFYEIIGWCYANKCNPRRMDIWIKDEPNPVFTCNLLAYPVENRDNIIDITAHDVQQVMPEEIQIDNYEEPAHCIQPILDEHVMTDEMDELTECERSYANHLKYMRDN